MHKVQDQSGSPILPGSKTPGDPAGELNDMKVESVQKADTSLSASTMQMLSTPMVTEIPLVDRTTEKIDFEALQTLVIRLQTEFKQIQKGTELNAKTEQSLLEREQKLVTNQQALQKQQEEVNDVLGVALKKLDTNFKLVDVKDPTVVILHLIKHSIPVLEMDLKKANAANTLEAKNEFAQKCSCVIGSSMQTALVISKEKPDLDTLKGNLTKNVSVLFGNQASADLLQFINMAIKATKGETAPVAPTTKEIWMARFLAAANALYPAIVASTLYAAGKMEGTLLNYAPEVVNDFILAIQAYAGPITVPLLCFAVGYAIYYAIQLGYMGKDYKWPATEEVKKAAATTEWTNRFAQNAVTV